MTTHAILLALTKLGFSRAQIAKRAAIHESAISRVLKGTQSDVRAESYRRLVQMLERARRRAA